MAFFRWLFWAGLISSPAYAQPVCGQTDILSSYGFQIAGTSTISGAPTPAAVIGRLSFDAQGNVSGVSSVNFNGFFLGNPVTGTYAFLPDCSLNFKLQDDSGGWQNFAGKLIPGGARAEFRQTDQGTGGRGIMARSADSCTPAGFQGHYTASMVGVTTPFADASRQVSTLNATIDADGNGTLAITRDKTRTNGTYTVDSDCFMDIVLTLGEGDDAQTAKLRGVLVTQGREALVIQTDPEQVAAGRFVR